METVRRLDGASNEGDQPLPSKITRIVTPNAPAPAGHYSQGLAWRDVVCISGQLPIEAGGQRLTDAPFEQQARQALNNLLAIASAGGATPCSVLKVTAYIVGIEHWSEFNRVFAELFGDARPARAVVPVPELHHGFLVEVEALAARSGSAGC